MQRAKDHSEPTRSDKLKLVSELEKRFGFTKGQAQYLVVNSYGYVSDIISNIKQIERSMNSLKKVLEGLEIK